MQRTHINLVLKKDKKNADGKVPIYLRITTNRKSVFSSTGHYIPQKMWDKKAQLVKTDYDYHDQINIDITNKKKEALNGLVQAGLKNQFISAQKLKGSLGGNATNIFSFCERLQKQLGSQREEGTINNWRMHMDKLQEFGGDKIGFETINADFLYDFDAWLRDGNVKNREGKDPGSWIAAIMRTIRKLFNEAIGHKIIPAECYPFKRGSAVGYEIPKQAGGNKKHLSLAELDRWEQFVHETDNDRLRQTAIYFLFGCYTGLRVSDWKQFTFSQVHKDYLSLRTTKNKEWVAIPIHNRLKRVLPLVKQTPLTNNEQEINRNLKAIAKQCGITKSLSTHSGRKTFAVTMCLDMGVSSETAATLMGITLAVFVSSYSRVTPQKIRKETSVWNDIA